MRLVKAAKASPHAKFYSLSTVYNQPLTKPENLATASLLEPVNLGYHSSTNPQTERFCPEIAKCSVANATKSKGLKRIFANKGNLEKDAGHLFITSSSSHFLNKTVRRVKRSALLLRLTGSVEKPIMVC